MPLVERYGDWDVNDDSYDDPHTLTFDHRISASSSDLESVKTEEGLCGVKKYVHPEMFKDVWMTSRPQVAEYPQQRQSDLLDHNPRSQIRLD